jgi:uncharacterized membrane protein YkvA (DUF1232 family)
MRAMHIVLDLSEKDLRYFRECLQTVKRGKLASDEIVVLKAARDLVAEVTRAEAPDFVRDRLGQLTHLVEMLEDERWRLTGADRARVLNALAYFVDPDDLIPDRIPGIGYLDDAIMVELVVQELRHEIDAYEKFVEFHQADDRTPEEIARKRLILQSRMRRERRTERDRRRERRGRGVKAPPGLW